ncbi:MAG TPA: hypothetical protein VD866_06985 [Urbifossiella sp.]|nr:hypothetical protein [Urbifossiella sp.]
MAKRVGGGRPSRMDKRREHDAVEAQEAEKEKDEVEDEVEDAEPEAEADADEGDGDEDGKPKKKKKKAPAKKKAATVKKPAAKRTRTAKEVRMKALWIVFDNGSKVVEKFPYNQKADAEALLARKIAEKEGKIVFYINLVKEPLE